MDADLLKKLYAERKIDSETTERAVRSVSEFEGYLGRSGISLSNARESDIRSYLSNRPHGNAVTTEELLAIGRYCYLVRNNEIYIYIVRILYNGGLYDTLSERIAEIAGEDVRKTVFSGISIPPEGSPPEAYPGTTGAILFSLMNTIPEDLCRKALTVNLHGIPAAAFADAAKRFAEEPDIDKFLREHHARAVAVLEEHAGSGEIWYEQVITPEVVNFVRANQEILSAVREGHTLYATKIPYDPDGFLRERDPDRKRYLACHCPLARESLASGRSDIPGIWCYCSAGYEKVLFDTLFGEPAEVTVLETLLNGDDRCRFAITIPEKVRKLRGIS